LRSIGVWRRECLARVEITFKKVNAWLRPFWLKSKSTKSTRGVFSGRSQLREPSAWEEVSKESKVK
jgi:hypothetical protein